MPLKTSLATGHFSTARTFNEMILLKFPSAIPLPKAFHTYLLSLCLATGILCPVYANDREPITSAAEPSDHAYNKQADLPNFHVVHSFLFRGGEPTPAGLKQLQRMGVKTIIDLRAHPEMVRQESEQARALGMQYINLPMSSKAPTSRQIGTFITTVSQAEKAPDRGAVFVHCAHGSDRTGCLIGIWRVSREGWSYDQAYKEMRQYYFTPKFSELSGTVRRYARQKKDPGADDT